MPLTKTIFREKCLRKIKESSRHNKLYTDTLVNKMLWRELKSSKKSKILFYIPLSFEADVSKTLKKLKRKNEIFIPFMEGESFKMVPFRLPLKIKKFGILEAGNTHRKITKIDIAIVPAVGVDGNLQRVGFGKGMYDRFFARFKKKPYTIFIQPKFCYTKKIICDEYDVACDLLLTPKVRLEKRN